MTAPINPVETAVCAAVLVGVTALGISARWWRRGAEPIAGLDQWGLAGRQFGTWVTWFLLGGDFYTAYTVIAVPALVYGAGASGFFALPYTIIVYPIVFATMPRIWSFAHRHGCMTAADVVQLRYGSRPLASVIALTGFVSTMPYIALQLVGLEVVAHALGLRGDLPILIAFSTLAIYTYSSGLRAPALIAFIKDLMIYIVVLAAAAIIPARLGGYAAVFQAAQTALAAKGSAGLLLAPHQAVPYATLALGSALAAFLYPHTLTGVLAARSADIIRRNAILLPAYTLLLGVIALLGYMALAAGINVDQPNDVVPALLSAMFDGWFAGFALAAIAVCALVPATVMSIGASTLIARNIWKPYLRPSASPHAEAQCARFVSLLVKAGALVFVIFLPVKFAIYLQLLGGLWILQTFPALILGLFVPGLAASPLLAGWIAGIGWGTWTVFRDGWAPVHQLSIAGTSYGIYTGLLATALNLAVIAVVGLSLLVRVSRGVTQREPRPG